MRQQNRIGEDIRICLIALRDCIRNTQDELSKSGENEQKRAFLQLQYDIDITNC